MYNASLPRKIKTLTFFFSNNKQTSFKMFLTVAVNIVKEFFLSLYFKYIDSITDFVIAKLNSVFFIYLHTKRNDRLRFQMMCGRLRRLANMQFWRLKLEKHESRNGKYILVHSYSQQLEQLESLEWLSRLVLQRRLDQWSTLKNLETSFNPGSPSTN